MLARALAQPRVATSLQEPPILTDVIAHGLAHLPDDNQRLLGEVTGLLSRPVAETRTRYEPSGKGTGEFVGMVKGAETGSSRSPERI